MSVYNAKLQGDFKGGLLSLMAIFIPFTVTDSREILVA